MKNSDKTAATAASNMYADTQTWSPFKGCEFDCTYCGPTFKAQAKRQMHNCHDCYLYTPHNHPERLSKIPNAKTVFVCGNADIKFCDKDFLKQIIEAIRSNKRKGQTFYLQSKEPACLEPVLGLLPENVVLVTTLETNRDEGYDRISKAPAPSVRFEQFLNLKYLRKVITAEPIMDFDLAMFTKWISKIRPEYLWLGLNSREKRLTLPEPSPEKLYKLAEALINQGIEVRGKKLRDWPMPDGVIRTQG
jgi:uncharacterized Fe-S cluster-containing radical SAM superfamily protein